MSEPATSRIAIPACLSRPERIQGNLVRQMLVPDQTRPLTLSAAGAAVTLADGSVARLRADRRGLAAGERAVRLAKDELRALPNNLASPDAMDWIGELTPSSPNEVLDSLKDRFTFRESDPDTGRLGLRAPQLGALHAVLGFWTTGIGDPATIVMPTGTGKTETMLALFAAARLTRLLVVVPSSALRQQIVAKFLRLGVLQEAGVVDPRALRPRVGQIDHRFKDPELAVEFCELCNVIVTTPNALLPTKSPEISAALMGACTHLFVDEAHHVEARTWRQIRDEFVGKPVVQFTATPFREDGRRLAGRQVYRFSLRLAQEQGYFSQIDYVSVVDLSEQDRAVASRAVARLEEDLARGQDHVLMARARSIVRAQELSGVYGELAGDHHPVLLHSQMNVGERTAALAAIASRDSRVIVCVDMLGEGFDLPALKVAAIHDPHRSLGVTLQFVGRFARVAGSEIGVASVFVGRPNLDYDHNLRRLFAEDADWNLLIRELSETAIGEQEAISEFEQGFAIDPEELSVRSLAPKMRTQVYKTSCGEWDPQRALEIHPPETLLSTSIAVNSSVNVAWFVVRQQEPVPWGDAPMIEDILHDLYVLYWDLDRGLLYLNSANTATKRLARAVTDERTELIEGAEVYRAMHGIQRLIPTNVGVLDVLDRDRRFTMYAGGNVAEGFSTAEARTKAQTNIFGSGFRDGERVSLGASLKGRVWSFAPAETLKHWVDWCDQVGPLLADETIRPQAVIESFILPARLTERPAMVALAIEWPIDLALSTSETLKLELDGQAFEIADVELTVTEFSEGGPIPFEVRAPTWRAPYAVEFTNGALEYRARGDEVILHRARREPVALSEYLSRGSSGPLILLERDAMILHPGLLLAPDVDLDPFPRERLEVLDWDGVDLKKESQGENRDPTSIQARTIEHVVRLAEWDVVLDDDGSGEVADIVAMRLDGSQLRVLLVHCKYSHGKSPGERLSDVYEVCGQAQKSTTARSHLPNMFERLIRREKRRLQRGRKSGFESGDIETVYRLYDESRLSRVSFEIAIAQPGLSHDRATEPQLRVLAGTEVYLRDVAKAPLAVWCSA